MQDLKVLIVEDENIVAMDLSRRLSKLGYKVVGMASSGKRALTLVEERAPDIILMDIHIKGNKDGIEVADNINELYQIPIIFLTAYSEDSTLSRARKVRPYGYLLKPFSERELHVAIQVAMERHEADQKLKHRETHLKLALDAAKLGTWETESNNESIIMGYSPFGVLTHLGNWQQIASSIVGSHSSKVMNALEYLRTNTNAEVNVDFLVNTQEDGERWFRLYGKSYNGSKAHHRVVGVLQDITEQRCNEEQLQQAATAFRCSADGIVVLNKDHQVISVNQAFTRITGMDIKQCAGCELDLISRDCLGDERYEELCIELRQRGNWQGESKFHDVNNRLIHALVNVASVPDLVNREVQYVLVLSDITLIRDAQRKLTHAAYYDRLTGLPNRNLFFDRLDMCMAKSNRDYSKFGLLFLDLDHFKRVNDTLGHQMGDSLLKAVALRMRTALRSCDTLCRLGGDEFIVIAQSIKSSKDLETLAKKLLDTLARPLSLDNHVEIVPSASIGICMCPEHTKDRDEMIKMADIAMYSAKMKGRNDFAVYHPSMSECVTQYFNRDQEFRKALENDEFALFYQPQFDARCGNLVGLEALIRWNHPKEGLLGANDIIPIAETSSLIVEIGKWVFEEACRQLRSWLDLGYKPGRISINVSARQLEDRHFAQWVDTTINQYQIGLGMIDLEVTESCFQDSEIGIHNLRRLRKMGANISIDDFGTGYSCMNSLKSLPISALKIDQGFVRHVQTDSSDRAIVDAVIALSKQLGLRTIAEGVETDGQAMYLRKAGCDEFQGYLFDKPLSAKEISNKLRLMDGPEKIILSKAN